jgi:hypothetical protein
MIIIHALELPVKSVEGFKRTTVMSHPFLSSYKTHSENVPYLRVLITKASRTQMWLCQQESLNSSNLNRIWFVGLLAYRHLQNASVRRKPHHFTPEKTVTEVRLP